MAKGYIIGRVDIRDMEGYKGYLAANGPAIAKFEGRFLVRAGRFECPEGTARSRNVVIEFPSYEAALAFWHSPDYQAVIPKRTPFSDGDFIVIEGYDGPQPA